MQSTRLIEKPFRLVSTAALAMAPAMLAALLSTLLSACASYPTTLPGESRTLPSDGATSAEGYYLDDGPPTYQEQLALANTPDAVVKREPINEATTRPYIVLDKRYVPFTSLQPYRKRGTASWYGKRYHGRKTASGETYDMFKMSAAHPILPIPSYVRVTRVSTGKSIIVRINDRGPFLQGREIDLSYAAATKLGIVKSGTGEVIVEALIPPGVSTEGGSGGSIERAQPISDKVFIQLAAFANNSSAVKHLAKLRAELPGAFSARISVYKKDGGLYVVQIGPYEDHSQAAKDDEKLCQQHGHCGFLTKRYR